MIGIKQVKHKKKNI